MSRFRIALIAALVGMVIMGVMFTYLRRQVAPAPPAVVEVTHTGPTIAQIRGWAALVSCRVTLEDFVTSKFDGFGGSLSAAVTIRGEALLGVDLEQAYLQQVDQSSRTLVLVLPQPTCQSA